MLLIFKGDTSVADTARKLGEMLYATGTLPGNAFVETFGQTGVETNEKIDEVLRQGGGILFIHNAYNLADDSIATLITAMENNQDNLCVIMAGNSKKMTHFINKATPGLISRIICYLDFPN